MACASSCQRFPAALVYLVPFPHPQLRLRSEGAGYSIEDLLVKISADKRSRALWQTAVLCPL